MCLMFSARPSPPADKPKFSDIMSTSCQLDWNPPDDDGGSPVTSYIVEQLEIKSNDVVSEWRHLATVHVRHMMVRGLVTGAKYKFRVAAENYYGTSEMGEESEILSPILSADSDASSGMNYDALGMSIAVELIFSCNLTFEAVYFHEAELKASPTEAYSFCSALFKPQHYHRYVVCHRAVNLWQLTEEQFELSQGYWILLAGGYCTCMRGINV